MSYASIRLSLYALLHSLFAMNVFIISGFANWQFFCRCLSRLAVALIVVSSYASLFIHSIVFMMVGDDVKIVGDGVKLVGDDDAVPDRPLCGYEELMTDRPL